LQYISICIYLSRISIRTNFFQIWNTDTLGTNDSSRIDNLPSIHYLHYELCKYGTRS